MKKFFVIVLLVLLLSTSAQTESIKDFKIEKISIGDSALDYFTISQLEDNVLDWYNYSYKDFSTSLVPGKGIYDWFKVSYRSDDDDFIIEGLVGIIVKKNYEDIKCNRQLDEAALSAVKKAKWKPARQREKKVGVWQTVPVRFELK